MCGAAHVQAAIKANVPVYADLSDPLEYLEAGLRMSQAAAAAGTSAVLAAGAFPGFSNVLAMECAARLQEPTRDVKFSYFTAGGWLIFFHSAPAFVRSDLPCPGDAVLKSQVPAMRSEHGWPALTSRPPLRLPSDYHPCRSRRLWHRQPAHHQLRLWRARVDASAWPPRPAAHCRRRSGACRLLLGRRRRVSAAYRPPQRLGVALS
jgi:hypothetical protein